MAGIFVSYRRSSAGTTTYRLVDDLRRAFGAQQIFLDVESIQPGMAFAQAIQQSLGKSSVALIMIGPEWATVSDDQGKPRLHTADDWVRQEVRAALDSNARVIPVLIEGAQMPTADQLPDDIKTLAQLQAFTLLPSQTHWAFDVNRLIDQIATIDARLKRIDNHAALTAGAGAKPSYSYKVISGYVIYGLVGLTALTEGWVDSDEVLGAVVFFIVAGGLFYIGLKDIGRGISCGKKGAIVGIVLSALSIVGHLASYSVMLDSETLAVNAQAAPAATGSQHETPVSAQAVQPFVGSWVSPDGVRLQVNQIGVDINFAEYNAFGGQVGQGEGVADGNQMSFSYYNSLLGINAAGTATSDGNALNMTLTEPNSGQQFSYTYYRQ